MPIRIAVIVVALAACSKKSDDAPPAQPVVKETPPPAAEAKKPALTAAWLGKPASLPGQLAKLTLPMPLGDATKLVAIAKSSSLEPSELDGVGYGFDHDTARTKVTGVLVELPFDKVNVVTDAWGAGRKTDRGGTPVTVWFDPEHGVRATLSEERKGESYAIRYEPYVPVGKLLGDGPAIAMLAKPFVGKTKDDLAKIFPELAGAGDGIWLPQTEWEFGSGIPVSPYPLDGPIESLAFSIPFVDDASKAEIRAAIEKKWGKVKAVEEPGGHTEIFNKAKPRIEVSQGEYTPKAITIRVADQK